MEIKNLSFAEGTVVPGTVVDENTFSASVSTSQLFHIAADPRESEDAKARAKDAEVEEAYRMRTEVQRLFSGAKEKNVEPYSQYLLELFHGAVGQVPAIILWSEKKLKTEVMPTDRLGYLQVPFDARLIAIDGETQLAARYEAKRKDPKFAGSQCAVIICHGRNIEWARQAFHDLNMLGVQPNAAVAISMDNRDALTAVARHVETHVPLFSGRINKTARQLPSKSNDLMTITALRGACVTLAEGISGVKYGAGPVPVDPNRLPKLKSVATEWFSRLTQSFGGEFGDRDKLITAPPVMAALGAMGFVLTALNDPAQRNAKMDELIKSLSLVDWARGPSWEGIVGKFSPGGKFSVGGTKETVHTVYKALSDSQSQEWHKVRKMPVSNAVAS